jgi:Fur family iron response transcriptional regulator
MFLSDEEWRARMAREMSNAKAGVELRHCTLQDVRRRLRDAGLRPTQQRIALGWLLFGKGDRHATAEQLFEEAAHGDVPLSLATVYNTLRQFSEAGLVREIALYGSKIWYDTKTGAHHHYYVEGLCHENLADIPDGLVRTPDVGPAPEGMEIVGVDVIVRLRPKAGR